MQPPLQTKQNDSTARKKVILKQEEGRGFVNVSSKARLASTYGHDTTKKKKKEQEQEEEEEEEEEGEEKP